MKSNYTAEHIELRYGMNILNDNRGCVSKGYCMPFLCISSYHLITDINSKILVSIIAIAERLHGKGYQRIRQSGFISICLDHDRK